MKRPQLRHGDLVKINKRYLSELPNVTKDSCFKVVGNKKVDRITARRLGISRHGYDTTDGVSIVLLEDKAGKREYYLRKYLWRIPNQPRSEKKRLAEIF